MSQTCATCYHVTTRPKPDVCKICQNGSNWVDRDRPTDLGTPVFTPPPMPPVKPAKAAPTFELDDIVTYIGDNPKLKGKTAMIWEITPNGIDVHFVGGEHCLVMPDSLVLKESADAVENHGTKQSKTTESVFSVNSDAMEPDANRSGLVDSGERVSFGTGAVREASGKGRCDLLPWDIVGELLGSVYLDDVFCRYMDDATRRIDLSCSIKNALCYFIGRAFDASTPTAILEAAHQFEAGAVKYENGRNWEAGIPLDCFLSSAGRHYLKWLRGDTDEPHDRAVVWNLLCALWTVKNRPEMIDAEVPK